VADSFGDGMKKFLRKVEKAAETHTVSFAELFPNSFVRLHSRFQTMQEFANASGVEVKGSAELGESTEWNSFVIQNTDFGSWQDMARTATAEHMKRRYRES
jgi:hypothetical protein